MKIQFKLKTTFTGNTIPVNEFIPDLIRRDTNSNYPMEDTLANLSTYMQKESRKDPRFQNVISLFKGLDINKLIVLNLKTTPIEDSKGIREFPDYSFEFQFQMLSIQYEVLNTFIDNKYY